jgi:hypothetical protein
MLSGLRGNALRAFKHPHTPLKTRSNVGHQWNFQIPGLPRNLHLCGAASLQGNCQRRFFGSVNPTSHRNSHTNSRTNSRTNSPANRKFTDSNTAGLPAANIMRPTRPAESRVAQWEHCFSGVRNYLNWIWINCQTIIINNWATVINISSTIILQKKDRVHVNLFFLRFKL